MLVDASESFVAKGSLRHQTLVDKLTGELKARKEAEKIAQEESKLEQERIAREEKLKSQFFVSGRSCCTEQCIGAGADY